MLDVIQSKPKVNLPGNCIYSQNCFVKISFHSSEQMQLVPLYYVLRSDEKSLWNSSVNTCSLTLKVPVTTIDALRHFETG